MAREIDLPLFGVMERLLSSGPQSEMQNDLHIFNNLASSCVYPGYHLKCRYSDRLMQEKIDAPKENWNVARPSSCDRSSQLFFIYSSKYSVRHLLHHHQYFLPASYYRDRIDCNFYVQSADVYSYLGRAIYSNQIPLLASLKYH